MAWITTVTEEEATGAAAEGYDRLRSMEVFMGRVPNIYKSMSQRPEVMNAFITNTQVVSFGGSGRTPQEAEMVSTVGDSINHCHY